MTMHLTEADLTDYRHAVALCKLARAGDGEGFVKLLCDPDVDAVTVVARLCDLLSLTVRFFGDDPGEFLDRVAQNLLAAVVDPEEFARRWLREMGL